ncbi:MAG: hypothetical protein L6R41_000107 [Letrouitia leprolyta]|nr:MAG: hypothetical protein L6R41_000107 [Letrouitia leprolyta]
MNWTGGSLSRSRKQNSNLTVIQKEHFAKARAQLLGGCSSRPRLDTTIFGDSGSNNTTPSFESVTNRPQEQQNTQLTLLEFESVRPVVKQLQSLRPRYARDTTAQPRTIQSVDSPHSSRQELTTSSPYTFSSPHDSASTQRVKAQATKANDTTAAPAQDELESKRRDLLGTSNWIGLNKLQPIRIKFPEVEDRDLIGKRRRIRTDEYQAIPATNHYRRPIINPYEKLQMLQRSSNIGSSPGNISVHIGSSSEGSSRRRGGESSVGNTHQQAARASQEMLFDDQESAKAVLHGQTSTPSSLQQSMNTSDEMLFDREWSGIASPLGTESIGLPEDSHRNNRSSSAQPTRDRNHAPLVNTASVSNGSDHMQKSHHTRKDLEGRCVPDDTGQDRACFRLKAPRLDQGSSPIALVDPIHSDRRAPAVHEGVSGRLHESHAQPRRRFIDKTSPERRPLGTRWRANSEHLSKLATVHTEKQLSGQSFAQATARDLFTLVSPAGNPQSISHAPEKVKKSERTAELAEPDIQIDKDHRSLAKIRPAETVKPSLQTNVSVPTVQERLIHQQEDASVLVEDVSEHPLSGSIIAEPAPEQQPSKQAPPDPSPEDEEIIWRTFVFGTDDPEKDWTFENPIQISTPHPKPSGADISSPIHPLFDASSRTDEYKSSPIQKTQPSLLAEASSSSSSLSTAAAAANHENTSSSSPARPQPLPSTIADFASATTSSDVVNPQPVSGSPANRTQRSVQAQASSSSDELAISSSSPRGVVPPPVTFKRPRRFVGENLNAVQPVRLGGNGVRRRGGKKKDDDDAAYGESGRGSKGRKDWRGVIEVGLVEDEDGEEDEIID